MHDVLGLVLGGGRGTALYPLTRTRSEPAVPLAGKYRLIDIPLSNCINSGLRRVYVLTQYLSVSLHRHIANTYKFSPFSQGFIEILAAQQTNETSDWYRGTADAVRQNLHFVTYHTAREVLLLSGDQLYRMDLEALLASHRDRGADVTIAVVPVGRNQASRLGVITCDDEDRVVRLVEKPKTEDELNEVRTPARWLEAHGTAHADRDYLANMGIYVFSRTALQDLLQDDPSAVDLVCDIFPRHLATRRFHVHLFDGYWDDIGSIRSYHAAHMALAGDNPPFDFASVEGVIYTRMRYLPAARVHAAYVNQALVSDGCLVQTGSRVERSVIGVRSQIGRNVVMRDTVLNGADYFESPEDRAENERRGRPHLGIGEGSVIEGAILDKDCRIGRNVRIVNEKKLTHADGPNYAIRQGIVVIPDGAVIHDGTVI